MNWRDRANSFLLATAAWGAVSFVDGLWPAGDLRFLVLIAGSFVFLLAINVSEIISWFKSHAGFATKVRLPDWLTSVVAFFVLLFVFPYITWMYMPAFIPAFSLIYRLVGALMISSWVILLFLGSRLKWKLDIYGAMGIMLYSTPEIMFRLL